MGRCLTSGEFDLDLSSSQLFRHIDTIRACCQIGTMTSNRQSRSRTLRAAVMLLAVLALVVARSVTATAGLALPSISGHIPIDCPSHAHPTGHHHDAAHSHAAAHAGHQAVHETDHEHPAHLDDMRCCVTAAALVIPLLGVMPLPSVASTRALLRAHAVELEGRIPEGPSEPPRTADQA